MAELPKPVRAYIGLWARAISEARDLPRRAAGLPVIVASTTARATLRAGQEYADLITRGDDVLSRLQGAPEEPPAWATFDDDLVDGPTVRTATDDATPLPEARTGRTGKGGNLPRDRKLSAFDTVELEEGPDER